ncbi:M20/M25/M40 family metallo-hydrolase [Halocalculus aciditolerans]|uniref:Peptidase M20 dimerisation domain-containing protein n=1 Tax=Halocalculus aciditolerans TaxID=1383812 RepID=A0A830FCU4_9EURY|nr:M20/M25/M40 family metallo-hydrolase [Halocalculus aciditolerans]GGL62895.1 hypothetical protein GCM10009039_21010 [Halocalculus aciditolerans]
MTDAEFDPVAFLEAGVRIDSTARVDEMRRFVRETLGEHGVESRVDDAGNLLASKGDGGDGDGGGVLLNTHLDTVPPHVPFARDDGRVRGRGSCDAIGPMAAMLAAFLAADDDAAVTLALTPDEETNSTGAAALDLDADCVVVGEPTGLDRCTAARGRFQATVSVTGTAAHAAEPESGASAIQGARRALEALETYDGERGPSPHPVLGAPTLTATTIEGGNATNQVPAECSFVVDRRTVPPESAGAFFDGLRAHLRAAVPDALGVEVTPAERDTPFLEAFATDRDERVVNALGDAGAGRIRPFTAATEASYFAADAPTVVFGPGVLADDEGAVAHADREYVDAAAVEDAAAILTDAVDALA